MPKILVTVEGKGNGIKTILSNIKEISKAIYRKPTYLLKYFGIELGTQTKMDETSGKFSINGSHQCSTLQEIIHNFIKKFVLCAKCGNPETMLAMKKKTGCVAMICKACGHSDLLDFKHKLTQYIINNPPEKKSEGIAPAKLEKNQAYKDIRIADGKNEIADPSKILQCVQLENTSSVLEDQHEPMTEFFNIVNTNFLNGTLLQDKDEIRKKAETLKLNEKCVLVLLEIIFNNPKTILSDVKKYKSLFHLFTRNGKKTKRYQSYVIGGLLKIAEKFNFANNVLFLIEAFYDHDIIEEGAIVSWYDKGPSKKYISKELCKQALESCKPLVESLKKDQDESVE